MKPVPRLRKIHGPPATSCNPPAEAAYACGVRRARIAHATGLTTGCKTSPWVRRCHGVEIFRGQARRRGSDEAKCRLVAETLVPGATVHAVAQRHGVNTSQLFTWRKRFRTESGLPTAVPVAPAFAAVEVAPVLDASAETGEAARGSNAVMAGGVIEIELPKGGRVRISGRVEPAMVRSALRALVRR
jgi:transposase